MRLRTRATFTRAIAAATTVGVIAAPLALTTTAAQAATGPPPLKVMTRNLYLGVDIMRPLEAVAALPDGATQEQILGTLANATHQAREIVEQTDFGTRSKLLAQEIATAKPDLVGLQEVALWRSGPLQLDPASVAVPNATTVDLDFLRMLRRALRAEGVPYTPVSVNWLSDVESPSFNGTPATSPRDVRLTMRDVILKRVGSGITVLRHNEKEYRDGLEVVIAGKQLDFTRGFQWIDARRGAKRFRFVNTHLEAFSSDMAYAQMKQMLEGPASRAKTTIIACDCNSDPLNQSVKSAIGDTLPHSEPYWLATGKHEYFDTWLQWRPARRGFTSGLNELVDEPADSSGRPLQDADTVSWTHRIDLVLARRADGGPLRVVRGEVTGDRVGDRYLNGVDTGLWPSDHAGVMMSLRGL